MHVYLSFFIFLLEIGKEKTQMIIRQSYDKSSNLKSAYNDYQYNVYNQNIFTGLFWRIFNPVIVVLLK